MSKKPNLSIDTKAAELGHDMELVDTRFLRPRPVPSSPSASNDGSTAGSPTWPEGFSERTYVPAQFLSHLNTGLPSSPRSRDFRSSRRIDGDLAFRAAPRSRPVSPGIELPTPSPPPSAEDRDNWSKRSSIVGDDGQTYFAAAKQREFIPGEHGARHAYRAPSNLDHHAKIVHELFADPPDHFIHNGSMFEWNRARSQYGSTGQWTLLPSPTASIPGASPTRASSSNSAHAYATGRSPGSPGTGPGRPGLSRSNSFVSGTGAEERFYGNRAAAARGSTRSLVGVLEGDGTLEEDQEQFGLRMQSPGTSSMRRRSTYSADSGSPSSRPTSSLWAPSTIRDSGRELRHMYSSASGLIGHIGTLPEEGDAIALSVIDSPSTPVQSPSQAHDLDEDSSVKQKKRQAFKQLMKSLKSLKRKSSASLRSLSRSTSRRSYPGTLSPVIDSSTGEPLAYDQYGYEALRRQPQKVPFISVAEIQRASQMSEDERREYMNSLREYNLTLRQSPSESDLVAGRSGQSHDHAETSFRNITQGASSPRLGRSFIVLSSASVRLFGVDY
ncbi:uncharacterized protein I303_102446 [Kwoniella dejecticola CBS 10117]|uniref:Uncharacterized protein n=1 Tax=Kwoniella dejecticola CBS 10117 TaxID=1296121 RepID=A0A1A6A8R8_9TREE|nr:uncharacterized protein I303_02461 [Kwoniella dejecticola CBS 10117]OBR86454.1 hypothetical protein I303_02461 [Kwoniella dejecticola CBS 10117]